MDRVVSFKEDSNNTEIDEALESVQNIVNKLTCDDIKFLVELGNKRKTQEKDGCADPVFWMIEDEKNVYCEDGEYYEFYDDGEVIYSTYNNNTKEDLEEFKEWFLDNKICSEYDKECLKDVEDDDDLFEWIDDGCIQDLPYARFTRRHFISYNTGAFLTKEAAREHIEENYYHYSKNVRTYGMVGWRNPEFERLMEIIEKLGDVE